MSKKKDFEQALKEAMRAKDSLRKSTLRGVLTAIKEAEVREQSDLDDTAILAILQKEVKSRQESIADAERAGRDDLIKSAQAETAVLEEYLPEAISDEELEALVIEAITEVGASTPGDMGKVMKLILPRIEGRADGGKVSQVVRQKLQGE